MRNRSLVRWVLIVALLWGAAWLLVRRAETPRVDTPLPEAPRAAAEAAAASAPAPAGEPDATARVAPVSPAPSDAPEPVAGPVAALEILCVDAHDGRALPGIALHVEREANPDAAYTPEHWKSVTNRYEPPLTDVIGRLRLAVPVSVRLRVSLAGGGVERRAAPRLLAPLAEGEAREVRLEVAIAGDVAWSAVVVDAANGDPLAGVRVERVERSQTELVGTTGNDGRIELRATSWSPATLRLELAGFVPLQVALDTGEVEPDGGRVLRLARGATLKGHLFDERGEALQMSSVHLTGPAGFESRAFCDAQGAFEFEGLPPGLELGLEIERWRRVLESREPLAPFAAGETRLLELRLAPRCSCEALVIDEAGAPVPGANYWVVRVPRAGLPCAGSNRPEGAERRVTSDEHGRIALSELTAGTWALQLDEREVLPGTPAQLTLPRADGAPFEIVHFRKSRIRGRVLDADGNPLAPRTVSAVLEGCEERSWIRVGTDGSFVANVRGPGSYLLQSHGTTAPPSAPVRARAGDENVELREARLAELRLRLRGPGGSTVRGARVLASSGAMHCDRDLEGAGEVTLRLAAGECRILAEDEDGRWSRVESAVLGAEPLLREIETVDHAELRLEASGFASSLEVHVSCAGLRLEEFGLEPAAGRLLRLPAGELELEYRLLGSSSAWTRRSIVARAGEQLRCALAP